MTQVNQPLSKEELGELLAEPFPPFDAWVRRMPDLYWARYDLSACKLGWMAAIAWVNSSAKDPLPNSEPS